MASPYQACQHPGADVEGSRAHAQGRRQAARRRRHADGDAAVPERRRPPAALRPLGALQRQLQRLLGAESQVAQGVWLSETSPRIYSTSMGHNPSRRVRCTIVPVPGLLGQRGNGGNGAPARIAWQQPKLKVSACIWRQAAAIQAYETSVVEESAAQLSGSTGHSPAPRGADRGERDPISSTPRHGAGGHSHQQQQHGGAFVGDPVASAEAALAAQQRQVRRARQQVAFTMLSWSCKSWFPEPATARSVLSASPKPLRGTPTGVVGREASPPFPCSRASDYLWPAAVHPALLQRLCVISISIIPRLWRLTQNATHRRCSSWRGSCSGAHRRGRWRHLAPASRPTRARASSAASPATCTSPCPASARRWRRSPASRPAPPRRSARRSRRCESYWPRTLHAP